MNAGALYRASVYVNLSFNPSGVSALGMPVKRNITGGKVYELPSFVEREEVRGLIASYIIRFANLHPALPHPLDRFKAAVSVVIMMDGDIVYGHTFNCVKDGGDGKCGEIMALCDKFNEDVASLEVVAPAAKPSED